MKTTWAFGAALAGAALLAACGGGNGNDDSQLKLSVTDAPVDGVDSVVVEFTGIEIKPANSDPISIDLAAPAQIDLLDTVNGNAIVLIDPSSVPAGDYEWLRLKVVSSQTSADHSYVLPTGSTTPVPLFVPSGSQSGLKLIQGFTVPEGGVQALTVDFDLRHSVVKPNGVDAYSLKPVLRLVEDDQVGKISGTVAPALLAAAGCTADPLTGVGGAVYVYEGADQVPYDMIPNDAGSLVLSTGITLGATPQDPFTFTIAYLPAGSYTVAFTCQGLGDDPEADDTITFAVQQNVTIAAGQTSAVTLQ